MAEQQVHSDREADFGKPPSRLVWPWDSDIVPPNKILEITTLTLAYFPTGGGTVGQADIAGRDSSGTAVWRVQVVYVEPKKTVHLTFPKGLRLEQGGHVEIGFFDDGPGIIFMSANGTLLDASPSPQSRGAGGRGLHRTR